ncbi:hypothetical protein ABH945_007328 [Paraburkholderia sp. GAS333]|uniref:hypothetical protein n=1 Tax=Paraburkholderia sp. GAS333 TaxID=3156279 RepID=UPI003D19927C
MQAAKHVSGAVVFQKTERIGVARESYFTDSLRSAMTNAHALATTMVRFKRLTV